MKEFESMIKQSLHDAVDDINADDSLKERIDFMLKKEKKIISFRKIAVSIAAVACIAAVGAGARGQIASLASSIDISKSYKNVSQLNEKADIVSEDISLPESLNGVKFDFGTVEKVNKLDENMNEIGYYNEVYAAYGDFNVDIHKYDDELDNPDSYDPVAKNIQEKDINGINTIYSTSVYLFVPPEYELTEDEQKMLDNNEINVSYGNDKREEEIFTTVKWQDGDTMYMLSTFKEFDSETMFSAAEEIINN